MPCLPAFVNFQPVSVVDQVAAAIRDAIQRDAWGQYLPGEHELTRQLGVSRPTVHRAIRILANEGLIRTSHGRRTQILSHGRGREMSPTACLVAPAACVVAPAARDLAEVVDHPFMLAVRAQVVSRGIGWQEVFDQKLGNKAPERRLERLVRGRQRICWLLLLGTPPLQRWFEKSGVPTLVLGSCQAGLRLPSIDWDYHALGWHAAGTLARQGHRRVVLILRASPRPGDLACRDGVIEYLEQLPEPTSLTTITAGRDAQELRADIDRAFRRRPRPTAVITVHASHALTAFTYLPKLGLRVPEDVSMVVGDTHPMFDISLPEMTRYRAVTEKTIGHVGRVVQQLLSGHAPSLKPFLITPTFVAGKTVVRPPPEIT